MRERGWHPGHAIPQSARRLIGQRHTEAAGRHTRRNGFNSEPDVGPRDERPILPRSEAATILSVEPASHFLVP